MSDERENIEDNQQPQYEHYLFQQEHSQEEIPDSQTGKSSFAKRLKQTIALAVVFGLISGAVFTGTQAVSKRFLNTGRKETSLRIGAADSEAETRAGKTEAKSASGKGTVAEVAQSTMPAVVAITSVSIQEIPSFFGYGYYRQKSAGSGSGIIVGENDEELFIATNNHVVEGAATLSVCFIGNDVVNAEEEALNLVSGDGDINVKDAVTAKIKGTDEENDLAVVTVKKKDIPEETMNEIKIAHIGSSEELVVGEQVVAIGNALGYGQSVTSGWISALDRSLSTEDGSASGLIQTDAAINPGNSGGALLNMNGELIGINSAKYADKKVEGMGYAIPISKALPILENLMNRRTEVVDEKDMAHMGVTFVYRTPEIIKLYDMPDGAFVSTVEEGQAAEKAGIRKGDIITRLDGQKINNEKDFLEKMRYYAAGETVELVIARANDGKYVENTLKITFDRLPDTK